MVRKVGRFEKSRIRKIGIALYFRLGEDRVNPRPTFPPPPQTRKVFLEFFQDELSSKAAVFSSCAHLDTSVLT